jgi:hypothetical protein
MLGSEVLRDQVIKIPTQTATDFQIYVQWLYTGRLHIAPVDSKSPTTTSSSLIAAYLSGQYLGDGNYKDCVMDALREWTIAASESDCSKFLTSCLDDVYTKTVHDDKLRELLVAIAVWKVPHAWWVECYKSVPNEFLCSVSVGLSYRGKFGGVYSPLTIYDKNKCAYHCHGEKKCYKDEQQQ